MKLLTSIVTATLLAAAFVATAEAKFKSDSCSMAVDEMRSNLDRGIEPSMGEANAALAICQDQAAGTGFKKIMEVIEAGTMACDASSAQMSETYTAVCYMKVLDVVAFVMHE